MVKENQTKQQPTTNTHSNNSANTAHADESQQTTNVEASA
jgi:hypothetical protein